MSKPKNNIEELYKKYVTKYGLDAQRTFLDIRSSWAELISDPGSFSLLVRDLAGEEVDIAEIVNVEENLRIQIPDKEEVFGLILLFPYRNTKIDRNQREYNKKLRQLYEENQKKVNAMFFAKQIVPNSCATHALLSITLNSPNLPLNNLLSKFKTFTKEMTPENKGYAIGNQPEFAAYHNRRAPMTLSAVSTLANASNKASTSGRGITKEVINSFHFVPYVPVDGFLMELDGLKDYPVNHGSYKDRDWMEYAREVIQSRMHHDTCIRDLDKVQSQQKSKLNNIAEDVRKLQAFDCKLSELSDTLSLVRDLRRRVDVPSSPEDVSLKLPTTTANCIPVIDHVLPQLKLVLEEIMKNLAENRRKINSCPSVYVSILKEPFESPVRDPNTRFTRIGTTRANVPYVPFEDCNDSSESHESWTPSEGVASLSQPIPSICLRLSKKKDFLSPMIAFKANLKREEPVNQPESRGKSAVRRTTIPGDTLICAASCASQVSSLNSQNRPSRRKTCSPKKITSYSSMSKPMPPTISNAEKLKDHLTGNVIIHGLNGLIGSRVSRSSSSSQPSSPAVNGSLGRLVNGTASIQILEEPKAKSKRKPRGRSGRSAPKRKPAANGRAGDRAIKVNPASESSVSVMPGLVGDSPMQLSSIRTRNQPLSDMEEINTVIANLEVQCATLESLIRALDELAVLEKQRIELYQHIVEENSRRTAMVRDAEIREHNSTRFMTALMRRLMQHELITKQEVISVLPQKALKKCSDGSSESDGSCSGRQTISQRKRKRTTSSTEEKLTVTKKRG